jgi:hypothetical protein
LFLSRMNRLLCTYKSIAHITGGALWIKMSFTGI